MNVPMSLAVGGGFNGAVSVGGNPVILPTSPGVNGARSSGAGAGAGGGGNTTGRVGCPLSG